jgi:hypothetical protein
MMSMASLGIFVQKDAMLELNAKLKKMRENDKEEIKVTAVVKCEVQDGLVVHTGDTDCKLLH